MVYTQIGDFFMGSIKTLRIKFDSQRFISSQQLRLKMSEVISLRAKVAQAEMAAEVHANNGREVEVESGSTPVARLSAAHNVRWVRPERCRRLSAQTRRLH